MPGHNTHGAFIAVAGRLLAEAEQQETQQDSEGYNRERARPYLLFLRYFITTIISQYSVVDRQSGHSR